MSGVVVFIPMETRGNFDPVKAYEEIDLHYKTLQGREIIPMNCCDCYCDQRCFKTMTFVYQICIPIISGIGQVVLINMLPSPSAEINRAANIDINYRMFNYLFKTNSGRQFALGLGFNDKNKITFSQFVNGYGGLNLVDWQWCYDAFSGNFNSWQLNNMVFQLGGYSLLSSLIVSVLDRTAPFVVDRLIPTDFPTEKYHEAKDLLKRTEKLIKRAANKLTADQKSHLENQQKSLTRLKNKVWILCGISGALFVTDLVIKISLVNIGLQQIRSTMDPQTIYQPGLRGFCWNQNYCNATLMPYDGEDCRKSYPEDFYPYAQETSTLNSSETDLGTWRVWTAVMILPLAGRVLEIIPVIYQTTKEAILRCRCCPKKKRALLKELE